MESDQQSSSSQGIGKRSASSDDLQDNKRLKPDEADSEYESLEVLLSDDDDGEDDVLLSDDDAEDDDDFDFDFESDERSCDMPLSTSSSVPAPPKNTSTTTYDILTPQELAVQMDERIKNACGVLQLPPTTVRVLLNHYSWNKEKLLDAYFGGGDAKTLFKDVGIDSPSPQVTQNRSSSSNSGTEDCLICCTETKSNEMVGMSCGHKFCKDCWRASLKSQILEQEKGAKMTCIAHNCSTLVDDIMFRNLTTDQNIIKKYEESVVESFVQTNPSYKWCPGPDCNKAIKAKVIDKINPQVKCKCGYSFCLECSGDAHAPITCEQLRKWQAKSDLDGGNGSWLLSNTKPCPKCKANIQKNGGCNHMTCKKCKFHFCWNCLQPLTKHSGTLCNQFAGASNASKLRNTTTFNLEQFVFYSNRFRSQQESLKIERQLFTKIQEQVEMFDVNMDIDFLKEAIEVLCECRQTLQFTYVFAYFVEKSNQVEIFVENQNDLQDAVEKLSAFLEADNDENSLMAARMKVRDLSNYCRTRRQVLIDHVFEGHDKTVENGGWIFNAQI